MMKICKAETLKREEFLNRQIHHQNLIACYKLMNINLK